MQSDRLEITRLKVVTAASQFVSDLTVNEAEYRGQINALIYWLIRPGDEWSYAEIQI